MTQDQFVAVAVRFARLFPDQGLGGAVDSYCDGFECPVNPPLAVKRAIVLKFLDDLPTARRVLQELTYVGLSNYWDLYT